MIAHDDEARPHIREVVKELAVDFQDGLSFFLALAALETKHCHTCHEPASTANALETHPD